MAASKGIAQTQKTLDEQRTGLAQILPSKDALAIQHERLQQIQDDLLEKSLSVVQDAVRFTEIDEDSVVPPDAWIEELGMDRAMTRWRIAKAAWRNGRDAPVGIKVAAQMAVGILKARATEKSGPKTLNVAMVQWPGELPKYVEQDYEAD